MKAIITWPGGKEIFEDCELGDPRVADKLELLAKLGIKDVSVVFEDDFLS